MAGQAAGGADRGEAAAPARRLAGEGPDRIILGEVRSGDAAIELIHAMNTGHAGSFSTVHANSASDALGRLEDLCAEVCPQPPCRSIATAIGCIAFLSRTPEGREISEVLFVEGWNRQRSCYRLSDA